MITSDAPAATCATELATLQVAIEAHLAQFGGTTAPSEAALVRAGLPRAQSTLYDIDPTGTIVPAGSNCPPG